MSEIETDLCGEVSKDHDSATLDHNQLKGDHLDWHSAFKAKLPAWVRQLEKAPEIVGAALPEWPLENRDCELPDVLAATAEVK